MGDVLVRHQGCEVQSAPAMQASAAEQTQRTVCLVFSVRPQLGDTNGKLRIG